MWRSRLFMSRSRLYKLGGNVKRSVRWFLAGLAQGIIAAGLIYYGYYHHHYYQIAGLGLLIPAVSCLAYGYVGILANRLSHIVEDIRNKRMRSQQLRQQYGEDDLD